MRKFWELDISLEDMNDHSKSEENMQKIRKHEFLTSYVYIPVSMFMYLALWSFYLTTRVDVRPIMIPADE